MIGQVGFDMIGQVGFDMIGQVGFDRIGYLLETLDTTTWMFRYVRLVLAWLGQDRLGLDMIGTG